MAGWVNMTSVSTPSGTYRALFDIDAGAGGNTGDVLYMTGDGAVPSIWVNNTTSAVGTEVVNTTKWLYMAMVRESATRLLLYSNCRLDATNTANVGARAATTEIGIAQALSTSSGEDLQSGQFEEIRIWRRALTQSELYQEMRSVTPVNRGGLISHTLCQTIDEIQDYAVGGRWTVTGTLSRGAPLTAAINWPRRRRVLNSAGTTAYTMAAATGTFTLTGNAAGLAAQRNLTAAQATYTLTGNAAGLVHGYPMVAASGSFTLTGNAAALTAQRKLTAAQATFTETGNAAGLTVQRKITATQASFTLTGVAAWLTAQRKLTAAQASYVLTGVDVTLTYTPAAGAYTLVADSATFVLTGNDAALLYTPIVTQSSGGGFAYFNDLEVSRQRRLARRRREKELEDQELEIQDILDRQIAQSLYEQELKDIERADLQRIQSLADSLMNQKTDLPRPMLASVMKAHEERTLNALLQLERVISQTLEEEEAVIAAILMLDD